MKKIFLSFIFLTLFSCTTSNQNTLTIAHFNDIYEIFPPQGSKHSRVAQASTIIKELRKNNSPVITTLGGDYLSPSAIGTAQINGKAIAGEKMVDVLNEVGLEWAVLGNHEFDLSEEQFLARLSETKFQIITSNITDKNDKLFPNTKSSEIISVKLGKRIIKIGLIGITIDLNSAPYVKYADYITSAKAEIAKMGNVDVIIALTHLSLELDQKLVTAVPKIDLVLGGHEHENWLIYRGSNLTPIVKADSNLRSIAIAKLSFSDSKSRPKISSYLQQINDKIIADPVIEAKVTKWNNIGLTIGKKNGFEPEKIIANLTENLDGRRLQIRNNSTNLTALINEGLLNETGPIDVAFFNSGLIRFDDILLQGPITEYDIIRTIPFESKAVTATITGSLLKKILEIGTVKNHGTSSYLQILGAEKQNEKWLINKKLLDKNKKYPVSMNDFLLSGKSANLNFLTAKNPLIKNIKEHRDIRKILIDAMAVKYPLSKH